MWSIRCGDCGKESAFELWVEGLGKDYYKCPKCKQIVRRIEGAPKVVNINGKAMVVPGDITLCKQESTISAGR